MSFFLKEIVEDGYSYYVPSTWGYLAIAICVIVLMLAASFFTGDKKKLSAKKLATSAVAIALASVLSMIKIFHMPMGGSITLFSMLFVTLIGYWYGLSAGIMAAFAYGCIQLILGAYVIHPVQLIIDYGLSFGALGLSGFFKGKKYGMIPGFLLGVTGRFVFAFISGMVFFGSSAAEYSMSIPVYSIVYNGAYLYGEAILTVLILLIPAVRKGINLIGRMSEDEEMKNRAGK